MLSLVRILFYLELSVLGSDFYESFKALKFHTLYYDFNNFININQEYWEAIKMLGRKNNKTIFFISFQRPAHPKARLDVQSE